MTSKHDLVPRDNIEIYEYIYCIETSLRELIIESLEKVSGSKWYNARLPNDVLTKYRNAKSFEQNIKWVQLVPHHPIYYIDFSDIKKVIEKNDNWKDVFESIFGRKEIVTTTLTEIEFIRNKVAHNRKVAARDVDIVKSGYTKILNTIGDARFSSLILRSTAIIDIYGQLANLQENAETIFRTCKTCKPINDTKLWKSISNSWWFDSNYLNHDLSPIEIYYAAIESYINLPQVRGCGYQIESWIHSIELEKKYTSANIEITNLISKQE
jgi:hypothetical protein